MTLYYRDDSYVDERLDVNCSLCEKPLSKALAMIVGPSDIYICEECVAVCAESVMNELGADLKRNSLGELVWTNEINTDRWQDASISRGARRAKASSTSRHRDIPTPREMYHELSKHVVGQDEAKISLSVAVYNHYMRINKENSSPKSITSEKSNILMLGPTGCGKTLLAQTLASMMKVPFAIADATTLTEAGYVGDDVENILRLLLVAAGGDVKRAERGIIFLDEVDKIAARNSRSTSAGRDVSGEGVQQALLKIIEGTHAQVPARGSHKRSDADCIEVNTENILFILSGAFPGLEDVVLARSAQPNVGFNSMPHGIDPHATASVLSQVSPNDLEMYGMLPELIGRTPVVVVLDALSEDDLVRIQTEPVNAIVKQFKEQFRRENCALSFTDEALRAAARETIERETGARGLRSIYERVLKQVMFELPDKLGPTSVLVDERAIVGECLPEIVDEDTLVEEKSTSAATLPQCEREATL